MPPVTDDAQLLRIHRKQPLFDLNTLEPCHYDHADIERMIPHRDPILFVDAITHASYSPQRIAGTRQIRTDDPLFRGHFPNNPIYPGCLVIESAGQLALCMYALAHAGTGAANAISTQSSAAMYLTAIAGALFVRPIMPGTAMRLLAAALPERGLYQRAICQALDGDDRVAMVLIGEVLIA